MKENKKLSIRPFLHHQKNCDQTSKSFATLLLIPNPFLHHVWRSLQRCHWVFHSYSCLSQTDISCSIDLGTTYSCAAVNFQEMFLYSDFFRCGQMMRTSKSLPMIRVTVLRLHTLLSPTASVSLVMRPRIKLLSTQRTPSLTQSSLSAGRSLL